MAPKQRMALQAEGDDFALLLTGFGKSLAKTVVRCDLPQGGDMRLMLSHK